MSPLHVLALVADRELVTARVGHSARELDQHLVEIAAVRWHAAEPAARGAFASAPSDATEAIAYLEYDEPGLLVLLGTTEGWI